MNRKNNIQDDNFIPEGLEFKEEYFEKAMGMYRRERSILRWKKALVVGGSLAAAACLVWFLVLPFFSNVIGNESTQTRVVSHSVVDKPANEQQQSNEEQSHIKKDMPQDISEEKSSMAGDYGVSASSGADSPDRQPIVRKRALAQDGIASSGAISDGLSPNHSQKAPGQTGLASSGAGSQDQEPVFSMGQSKSDPSNTGSSQFGMNEKSVDSAGAGFDQHQVSAVSTSEKNQDADLAKLEYFELAYREGKFTPAETGLKANTIIDIEKDSRFSFYLGVGMNIWSDYGRSKGTQIPAGYFVEGGLNYAFHHGWSLSAAPHYYYISGLTNPVVIENTVYGQGFQTTALTILTNQLHYGGLQVAIKKNLMNRHQVYAGYNLDYLINGNNTILTSNYSSQEYYPTTQAKTKGYVEGFEQLNHSLILGYQRFMGRYSAGVRGQFGLTDITKKGIFAQENNCGNSMVTLCLGINLNR